VPVTIGALVVRAGLDHGRHHHAQTPSTTVTSTTKKTHGHRPKQAVRWYTVVSGDTLAAIAKYGVQDRIGYISTGGGAFLEFLEGKKLPAVEILEKRAAA